MRLKISVTALFLFGLLLMAAYPWLIGSPPNAKAPRPEQISFVVRFVVYVFTLFLTFISTIVLSWVLVRNTRKQFEAEARENLKELIEGTLKDHEQKQR
jgi:cbb3-type cytochrome oxidase subunit 3